MSAVHPTWQKTKPDDADDNHWGWTFGSKDDAFSNQTGHGAIKVDDIEPEPLYGLKNVRQLYEMCGSPEKKYVVPTLWDTKEKTIVSNESSEIIEMFNSRFNELAENPGLDLAPEHLQAAMDEVNPWIYKGINNGVYSCGFAKTQEAYDEAVGNLFNSLDKLEAHLEGKKYLTGDTLTLSDIRLFVTLVRFDEVYVVYFKTDVKKISEYPNIFKYCCEMWKVPGIKETTNMEHIKKHYYTSHAHLNPFAIVPRGPDFMGQMDRAIAKGQ